MHSFVEVFKEANLQKSPLFSASAKLGGRHHGLRAFRAGFKLTQKFLNQQGRCA
jgi:hypothetical protein